MNEELNNILARIKKFKNNKTVTTQPQKSINSWTIAIECVSGAIVGIIIGRFLDKVFDSTPLFLIICLFIGLIASCKIIWQQINDKHR